MVDLAANEKTVHADFYNGEYFASKVEPYLFERELIHCLSMLRSQYYQHNSFLSNKLFCLPVPEIDFKFIYYVVQSQLLFMISQIIIIHYHAHTFSKLVCLTRLDCNIFEKTDIHSNGNTWSVLIRLHIHAIVV